MKRFLAGALLGLFLPPLVGLGAGRLGLIPVAATAEPSRWEAAIAAATLRASLKRQAALEGRNPVPLTEEALLAGLNAYRNDCAGCHGDFGHPSRWGTTGFYPRVPQFAEKPPDLPASQLFVVVKNGIRYSGMGAWGSLLSDDEIWRVVTFLSRLNSLPPRVETVWRNPPGP